ncbi:hypothetical protein C4J81_08265 [Deltaproteobacteria bacterium Smac51]|nr:hypothetical protein C4J81_08265 [Deltaproteobacteria bacterium Smac51]
MAKNSIRPYENSYYGPEKILGAALFISLGLHILGSWVFLFVIPAFESEKRLQTENIVTFQLFDGRISSELAIEKIGPVDFSEKSDVVLESIEKLPIIDESEVSQNVGAELIPIGSKVLKDKDGPAIIKDTRKPPPIKKPIKKADDIDTLIQQRIAALTTAQRGQGRTDSGDSYGAAQKGADLDPVKARYYSDIRDKVSKNWIAPANAPLSDLSAIYQITIEPNGSVSASRLSQPSGNAEYDDSVKRAVMLSSPFPPLPDVFGGRADTPAFRFSSNDLRRGG